MPSRSLPRPNRSPKIVCLTRFSFWDGGGQAYALLRDRDMEQQKALLFSEDRLAKRFSVFERVCLPSLQAQPSEDFSAVLLSSSALPEQCRSRLLDITGKSENIHVLFRDPQPYSEAFRQFCAESFATTGPVATLRLDDDDALAADYSHALSRYIDPAHLGHCVSFPNGLEAKKAGSQSLAWTKTWFMGSAGLAFISNGLRDLNIYHCGNHARVAERFPTLVDCSSAFYLQTLHGHNDAIRSSSKLAFPTEELTSRFPKKFDFLAGSDWADCL